MLGVAGTALAVVVVLFLGNPLSGLTSAAEMLPQPWGPSGSSCLLAPVGTLLRSVASFDGAGAAMAAWVLGAWAAGGLLLAVFTGRSRLRLPASRRTAARMPLREVA